METLQEKQLREENTSYSRQVSELASGKEEEWRLEMELTYLKTLLWDSRQRVLKAQDKVVALFKHWQIINAVTAHFNLGGWK